MTTALPARTTAPSGSPLPDMRRLRLFGDNVRGDDEGHGSGRELDLTYLEFALLGHEYVPDRQKSPNTPSCH